MSASKSTSARPRKDDDITRAALSFYELYEPYIYLATFPSPLLPNGACHYQSIACLALIVVEEGWWGLIRTTGWDSMRPHKVKKKRGMK